MKIILIFIGVIGINISGISGLKRLGPYNVDKSKITVSGISSGGAMAIQYQFVHSSLVSGVGVFAGGPYLCGYGGMADSLKCMQNPGSTDIPKLEKKAEALAAEGKIDPTSNLQGSSVYVFHGSNDMVVRPASGRNIQKMYEDFKADVTTEFNIPAAHGQPTANKGGACSLMNPQFLNNCGYDGAFEMLNTLYGGSLTGNNGSSSSNINGELLLFDQSEFLPRGSSMDNAGFLYVPTGCKDKSVPCALHVAFHGCMAYRKLIGNRYATETGYLEAAEANNIILLFPQTVSNIFMGNPQGCWDWWGYTNKAYPTRNGVQIKAVHRMVKRIIE